MDQSWPNLNSKIVIPTIGSCHLEYRIPYCPFRMLGFKERYISKPKKHKVSTCSRCNLTQYNIN